MSQINSQYPLGVSKAQNQSTFKVYDFHFLKNYRKLVNSAGNFYINDKPTGSVVGQQPFGGARLSGTNGKSGSMGNLMRWVFQRTIKEVLLPIKDWRYPFMAEQ